MINLDEWQKEFINENNDKILVSGRQTGKSEAAAYDNAQYALRNPKRTCLIVSKTERQAMELLYKTLNFLSEMKASEICKGKDRPTQSKIKLKNGSQIISLPTGTAGEGIRYLTAHKLTVDEAQLVGDDVFTAITPMLLTTGGKITLLGTPQGKQGYFWKAYENKLSRFKVFHVNSEEVIKNRPISETWQAWRKDAALAHLAKEKEMMSAKQYAQEYLGVFVEDLNQYFSDDIINQCCVLDRPESATGDIYMGVDIARMGGDEITYEFLEDRGEGKKIKHVESIVKKHQLTTKTEKDIITLDRIYNCKKIGIDAGAGSLGVGIFDRLREDRRTKRKVIAMNNRAISLDNEGKSLQKIFKEDMYDNLRAMMEKGEILLLNDDEVKASLKSVQIEAAVSSFTKVRIFGSYTHIVEGLIRAAYLVKKEKVNKVRISYI